MPYKVTFRITVFKLHIKNSDETLRHIAIELTDTIRQNVAIVGTLRESVQAKLRVMVKHILKKLRLPAR